MTDSTAKTNVDRIQKMMLNGQKKIWNYIYFITTTYNFIGMKTGRDHPKGITYIVIRVGNPFWKYYW